MTTTRGWPTGGGQIQQDEAERLYAEARALPSGARAAFVDEACRGAAELRAELVSLLENAEAAEQFFDRLAQVIISPRSPVRSPAPADGVPGAGDGSSEPHPPAPQAELPLGHMVGHYRILERIGVGGMGAVYRAHDTRLNRHVALKFLPAHPSAIPDAEQRLLAEARAAAALEHPNVCTIHEIGATEDARPFIAMALYRGETLKARILRGPLPVAEALGVAAQIARGLGAAHTHGIVHRDVKPGNVMLAADGTVKLLDFGLAKTADASISRPGVIPGTVAYMSPEQARGDPVDARSDLWSLGVVIYEMVTGVRPFRSGNDHAVIQAILHTKQEALWKRSPDIPTPLERIVERLLQKAPAARYQRVDELLADLASVALPGGRRSARFFTVRRPAALFAAAGIALLGLGIGGLRLADRDEEPVTMAAAPGRAERVLVADFANFTSDSLLGDAVSQALRIGLARSPALRVAGAPTVTATLRRMLREPDARLDSELAREVAMREGIRAVIDGEIRQDGIGFVISAALVEAATGEIVDGWRERAQDRAVLVDAVDRVLTGIRRGVGESLASLEEAEPLGQLTTSSIEALLKFSQARRAFQRGDMLSAAALTEEAIRLDSAFAPAHLMLAASLTNAGVGRGRTLEAHANAYRFRDRLSQPERHAVTANYYAFVVGDLPKAIQAYRNQIEAAKPTGEGMWYAALGLNLLVAGDLPGAEAVLQEARKVWPTAASHGALVVVLYRRGKLQEAAAVLQDAEQRFAGHPMFAEMRIEMAAAAGDYVVADSLAGEFPSGFGIGRAHRLLALSAAVRGRIREAIGHLRTQQREQLSTGFLTEAAEVSIGIARLQLVKGEPDAAVAEVKKFWASDPFDSLHLLDRPYLLLARFYADAGQPRQARRLLTEYHREFPEQFRGLDRGPLLQATAAIHLTEGSFNRALVDLERASRERAIGYFSFDDQFLPRLERPELARAYDRAGYPDSAIAVYERYLAAQSLGRLTIDAFELADTHFRLAELYEARGVRDAASRHYLRFADLWKDADPELQPRVERARMRGSKLSDARVTGRDTSAAP